MKLSIAETITRAVCTIDGKDIVLPIKSVTVEGATFKVNIYLDDTLNKRLDGAGIGKHEHLDYDKVERNE